MSTEKGKTFLEYGLVLVISVLVFVAVGALFPDEVTIVLSSLWSDKNIALIEIFGVACVVLLVLYALLGKTPDKSNQAQKSEENAIFESYFNPEVDTIGDEDLQNDYVSDYEIYKSNWPGLVELVLVVILMAVVVLGAYLYLSPIIHSVLVR